MRGAIHCCCLLLLALGAMLGFTGCSQGIPGSGTMKTEKRTVSEFKRIDLGGSFEATIETGKSEFSLTLTGDDNLLPMVLSEVKDGALSVKFKEPLAPTKRMTLVISMGELTGASFSGEGKIAAADLKASALKFEVSGAVEFTASGEAEQLEAMVSGAGNIDCKGLKTKRSTVGLSGAANVTVHASEELSAKISGVGKVEYFGNPPKVEQKISGVGKLVKGE